MKIYPQKTFVLTPLQAGPLKPDSGTISRNWTSIPGRKVMRDGQKVTIYDGAVTTFTGKRGTLTIRDRNEWVAVETRRGRRCHQHLEGRARDRPVRRDRRQGAGWPCGPRQPEVVRTLRGLPDHSVNWARGTLTACSLQAVGVGRLRNRSRSPPSRMRAVSPASDFSSWSSASSRKTASPAPIGSSTPFAPLTSPDPSSTARICGKVAGCRLIRPPGSKRKIAAWTRAPSSKGDVSGATET